MKKNTLLSFAMLLCAVMHGQKNAAEISKNVKQANLLMLEQNYTNALKYLLISYHLDSLNANINYKIGYCYLLSSFAKTKAEHYLLEATKNISKN